MPMVMFKKNKTSPNLGAYDFWVVRLDANGGEVEGEILEFNDPAVLKFLDTYEGYDPETPGKSLFVRRRCQVHLKEENLFCWVYEYNRQPPRSRRIDAWPPP